MELKVFQMERVIAVLVLETNAIPAQKVFHSARLMIQMYVDIHVKLMDNGKKVFTLEPIAILILSMQCAPGKGFLLFLHQQKPASQIIALLPLKNLQKNSFNE